MESIFKLGIILSVTDLASKSLRWVDSNIKDLRKSAGELGPVFDKFQTYGRVVAGGGALMLAALLATVNATAATQQALGELSSVGVRDLAVLERSAADFSNQWSGTTKAEFIAAAYDIKGGIASLSDSGVAEFAKLAALTGKATKSSTAEMTSLFATGYGIYKGMYADLSDMQFGQVFSAGIAGAVNIFKSTGTGMSQALSTLGASATQNRVPLEEQLTVLGMLQATMSGSEAGTKYRAMMNAAAEAGQKLKLPLVDANNQLLSMPEILNRLRGRYGDTLDAVEKIQIQKAFGTQEAVAVIDLLYGKVGDLTGNIQTMSGAMAQGTSYTAQMAAAMNADIGAGFALTGQRLHNLVEIVGRQLIPIVAPILAGIGRVVVAVGELAERFPTVTRVVVVGVAVIGGLMVVLGGLATAFGLIGLMLPAMVAGWAMVGAQLIALRAGVMQLLPALGSFAAASWAAFVPWFLAGGWIVVLVVAIVAVLGYLYYKFQIVRDAVHAVVYAFGYVLGTVWKFKAALLLFLGPLGMVAGTFLLLKKVLSGVNLFESGAAILQTLVNGIKSKATAAVEAVIGVFQKIRNLLPFSDAKEGPLSALTLSGARIMETLGAGVQSAAPGLHKTVAASLTGVALATTVAVAPLPSLAAATATESPRVAATERKGGRSIVIQQLSVTLPGVSDAESFVAQLQALVESYDA